MLSFKLLLITLFSTHFVSAAGLPVVDTNSLFRDMNDSIYTLAAVEDLLSEFNVSSNDLASLAQLKDELSKMNDDLRLLKDTYGDLQDISNPHIYKARILADYITQVTRYIRKVKKFLIMAQSMRQRPQAITAIMSLIREQRERDRDQYEAAMKSLEEKEKIAEERSKIRRRIEARQQLDREYSIVTANKSDMPVSSLKLDETRKSKGKAALW